MGIYRVVRKDAHSITLAHQPDGQPVLEYRGPIDGTLMGLVVNEGEEFYLSISGTRVYDDPKPSAPVADDPVSEPVTSDATAPTQSEPLPVETEVETSEDPDAEPEPEV